MPRATLVFLINNKQEVLLGMKKRGFGVGKWNGFGGKPDANESPLQTATRELAEEAGVFVQPDQLHHFGLLHFSFEGKSDRDQDVYVYKASYDGSFVETEEMLPQRRDIPSLPYDNMREDDKYRLPLLLENKKFELTFHFDHEGNLIKP